MTVTAASGGAGAIGQAKHKLAASMREARRAAHRIAGRDAAAALRGRLREARAQGLLLAQGAIIAGYWPRRDELDCRGLLHALHDEGFVCALPVVVANDRPLIFRRWQPGDTLQEGAFGIAEPAASRPEVRPVVLLVPLLAVDRAGRRLGQGKGYYDRTLAALRAGGRITAIGLCFEAQLVREVPAESHDERLDWVITERGAWRVAG